MPKTPNTVRPLLALASKTIPHGEADILLAHCLEKPKSYLLAHTDDVVSLLKRWRFFRLIKRRAAGIPIAYLTGHKEFYGLDFVVNKHTLIPRPETETMIDCASERITELWNYGIGDITLIDVGTGTGCIPIAINKKIKQKINKTIATDISRNALRVAKQNAKKHGVNMSFLHGNLLQPALASIPYTLQPNHSHLIITANLPYLTEHQFTSEPSIQHEPKSALVAEEEGLALYRKLLEQAGMFVVPCSLFLEIDPSQTDRIQKMVKKILPHAAIEIKKDLREQDRVVRISLSSASLPTQQDR